MTSRTLQIPYRAHVTATCVVLAAAIWLSTGTMAPYGATLQYPLVLEPCHYLVNTDHYHFEAVYRMILGAPPESWAGSVVLRRLLFPVVSYPLVLGFGFLAGGLLASVLLHEIALVAFAGFVRRESGERAAIAVLWLLATYPGITYWAGLPYSYVVIVPGSLFCAMLLYRIGGAGRVADVIRAGFLMGIIFTGYDLLPLFGPAVILILAVRRRFRWVIPAGVAMVLPNALVAVMFAVMGVGLTNANSGTYVTIVGAWLHPLSDPSGWLGYLARLPLIFASSFFFSNLIFLPLLAVAAWLSARVRKPRLALLKAPDLALLASAAALFLFLNAAPPYYGWQMRGHWLARLYQPVLPVLLLSVGRLSEMLDGRALRAWRLAVALTIAANASVAFGPVLMNPMAGWVYHAFYIHSPAESMLVNLQRFGRRPLGVCRASHEWDGIRNPNTPYNRPSFMYRYPGRD